jgi:hypothetical protein
MSHVLLEFALPLLVAGLVGVLYAQRGEPDGPGESS